MTDIKDALRQVPLFAKLPEAQLQWLSEQGKEVWLPQMLFGELPVLYRVAFRTVKS